MIRTGKSLADVVFQANAELEAIRNSISGLGTNKLDKLTPGVLSAYVVDTDGSNKSIEIATAVREGSLARRTSAGTLKASDGTEDDDLVTIRQTSQAVSEARSWATAELLKKVDIISSTASNTYQVYQQYNGTRSLRSISSSYTAGTLALRDSSGRLYATNGTSGYQVVNYNQLNTKLDKSGGTITGSLVINSNLTVKGTTTTENHKTLEVTDNYIVVNSDGVDIATSDAGIVIRKNSTKAYGIVYDPSDDAVLLGLGTYTEDNTNQNNSFLMDSGEGLPILVRDGLVDGNLIQYSSSGHKAIDSGKKLSDLVDLTSDQTIVGRKIFSELIEVDRSSDDKYGSHSSIELSRSEIAFYFPDPISQGDQERRIVLTLKSLDLYDADNQYGVTLHTGDESTPGYIMVDDALNGQTYNYYLPYDQSNPPTETWHETLATQEWTNSHINNKSNPHGVTKSQIGLDNVPNVNATNAANISSGTLPDARLSANICRINRYASASQYGLSKTAANRTLSGVSLITGGTTASRYYGVEMDDATGKLFVNIPWQVDTDTDTDTKYTAGDGLKMTGTTISLDQEYLDYLANATFTKPTIAVLTTNASSSYEVGQSITVTQVTHRETTIANIEGNLTLNLDGTTQSVTPSESSTNLTVSKTITRTTSGSATISLTGTDKRGNSISKSTNINFYYPAFYGWSSSSSLDGSGIQSLSPTGSGSISGTKTITLSSAGYIYLATTGTISRVVSDNFEVPMNAPVTTSVTRNGVTNSYKVYRTAEQLEAGTWTITIS